MHFQKLVLHNIRSYVTLDLEFPKGLVLLAGDIGSGKSSILLAIEFALFGIKQPDLPGNALLRHGKKEGSVQLSFSLGPKEITIKRTLKRTPTGVVQDAGFLIVDGVKQVATAKELRSVMFDQLGYPNDLVSKNKDLLYRYTLYTPQEALKQILYEKPEDRLDTLRRVFAIDKYKSIRDNSSYIAGVLRGKKRVYQALSADLGEKQKEFDSFAQKEQELLKKIDELTPAFSQAKKRSMEKKALLEQKDKQLEQFREQRHEYKMLEHQLATLLDTRRKNADLLTKYLREIEELKKDLPQTAPEQNVQEQLMEKEKALTTREQQLRACYEEKQRTLTHIEHHTGAKEKIVSLDHCPMCKQQVTLDHKSKITQTAEDALTPLKAAIEAAKEKEKTLNEEIALLRQAIEQLRKQAQQQQIVQMKRKTLLSREQEITQLQQTQDELKGQVGQLNMKKIDLDQRLSGQEKLAELHHIAQVDFDHAQQQEHKHELALVEVQKERESLTLLKERITKDIEKSKQAEKESMRVSSVEQWISTFFSPLLFTMEKHVMGQLNREFSELFSRWFYLMMNDSSISVRIDDGFTPLVHQNGYETSIHNLSGGEKTSVALAYRLALNKIINSMSAEIKTKDVLILDEPTDGFSTEQLDNMREVLQSLSLEQVIIVSHEPKIESFVDNVIRVDKENHESQVSA